MPANPELRDYLLSRRSVTLPFLRDPGPSESELDEMLTIANRVPDHGKLAPWRMVIYAGGARQQVGDLLSDIFKENHPDATADQLEAERNQFLPAPLTVGVISAPIDHFKIPQFEQLLAAGNVAFNLVHAANAFGYGAHWVTRWFAYDEMAAGALGVKAGERFVGFVHIGTPQARLEERDRPDLETVVSHWQS